MAPSTKCARRGGKAYEALPGCSFSFLFLHLSSLPLLGKAMHIKLLDAGSYAAGCGLLADWWRFCVYFGEPFRVMPEATWF